MREVVIGSHRLAGTLAMPAAAVGLVVFAHGSGSSRFSPRNGRVAQALNARGLATLLIDLLTSAEAANRANVFDIDRLGARVAETIDWAANEIATASLPIGLFGASTGAAAALVAAVHRSREVAAVVSRGGRPDLAGAAVLARVRAPTLLIVGGRDFGVIELNEAAFEALGGEKRMAIVAGATHLFEEPGALEQVTELAGEWLLGHLRARAGHG